MGDKAATLRTYEVKPPRLCGVSEVADELSASDCVPERSTDGAAEVVPRDHLPDRLSVVPVWFEGPVLGDNVKLGVDIVLVVRLRAPKSSSRPSSGYYSNWCT